jgi:hypothetical protein
MFAIYQFVHFQEHLHVYHAAEVNQERFAQPFHTDNGIMLMVTPFKEHPIKVFEIKIIYKGNILPVSR